MTHELKTWMSYYAAIKSGEKQFELRKNDRGFKQGDCLILYEYDHTKNEYTGSALVRYVTYVLEGKPEFGIVPGYCIMSLQEHPLGTLID
jgi:ASC-1-like (ASCH) protein